MTRVVVPRNCEHCTRGIGWELFWKQMRRVHKYIQKEREEHMNLSYYDYETYCVHCRKKIKPMTACVTEKSQSLLEGEKTLYYHQKCYEISRGEACTK